MSNDQRKRLDSYGRKAKDEGFAARSVYKLEELDSRFGLLRPGFRVLDLGCAPGSWMQYAARQVGPKGRVIGYDLKPLGITLPPHADPRVGDIYELQASTLEADGPFDLVLSDMAPSTTGSRDTDVARSMGLCEHALALAQIHLRPEGSLVVKVLEGRGIDDLVKSMRQSFSKVERLRPKATRKSSTEIFLIGLKKRAGDPT